ncbi:MAG TPA: hypothetical protein VNS58_06670 [Puia sp.]|nr:hypothetical protein [Puia sp.]
MRKISILLIIFSVNELPAKCQNAFYDARYITNWYNQTDEQFLGRKLESPQRLEKLRILDAIKSKIQSYYLSDSTSATDTVSTAILKYKLVNKIFLKLNAQYFKILGFDTTVVKKFATSDLIGVLAPFPQGLKIIQLYNVDTARRQAQIAACAMIQAKISSIIADSTRKNDSISKHDIDSLTLSLRNHTDSINKYQESASARTKAFVYFLDSLPSAQKETLFANYRSMPGCHCDEMVVMPGSLPKLENFQNSAQAALEERITTASSQPTSILSNTGGNIESEAINQLSILIVKRFKQEVALTFMDLLRKKIKDDSLLNELFQNTLALLNNEESFRLPRFGSVWSHALAQDFVRVAETLCNSSRIKAKIETCSNKTKELFYVFHDIVYLSRLAMQQVSVPDIVSHCYSNNLDSLQSNSAKSFIRICYFINNQLYDSTTERYWLNWNVVTKTSKTEWELFADLLAIRYGSEFLDLLKFTDPADATPAKLEKIKKYFCAILEVLNTFEKNQQFLFSNTSQNIGKSVAGINFWDLQNKLLQVVLDTNVIKLSPSINMIFKVAQSSLEVYKLLQQKDYAGVLHESIGILDTLLPRSASRIQDLFFKTEFGDGNFLKKRALSGPVLAEVNMMSELFDSARECRRIYPKDSDAVIKHTIELYRKLYNDPSTTLINLDQVYRCALKHLTDVNNAKDIMLKTKGEKLVVLLSTESLTLSNDYLVAQPYQRSRFSDILRVCSFLSDVLSVKNEQDLGNVIQTYAAPPNSYKIKRNTLHSWDLNAYVGTYVGTEFINNSGGNASSGAPVYGFTVPIGFTYSVGTQKTTVAGASPRLINKRGQFKSLNGNCWSFSLTAFDLAAVVAYRFQHGETGELPKQVSFAQLFSPGFHVTRGIRNTPLCVAVGWEHTPQLRTLTSTSEQHPVNRLYAGLFFDIPLYNIYYK